MDATVSEGISQTVEWTSHPISGEADASDHGVVGQRSVSITGVITNTPLAGNPPFTDDPLADAERALFAVLEAKNPCQVTTGLKYHPELFMASLDVTRDQSTGQSMNVSVSFVKLRRAEAVLIDVPTDLIPPGAPAEEKRPEAEAAVDTGTQTGEQKTEAEVAGETNQSAGSGAESDDKSIAAQGVDAIKDGAVEALSTLGAI